jgi:serine/threonine protein kinase
MQKWHLLKLSSSMELPLSTAFHGYLVAELLGKGTTFIVYRVLREQDQTEYAAKIFRKRLAQLEQIIPGFLNGLLNVQSVPVHPSICQIHDHFVENGFLILITDFCSQGSLPKVIGWPKVTLLSDDRFSDFARQLSSGLSHCHRHGIAHGHIRLNKVLLDGAGNAKLCDFGIPSLGIKPDLLAESFFRPPELVNRELVTDQFKCDIWSLGIVFAYMMNGGCPWAALTGEDLEKAIITGRYFVKPRSSLGYLMILNQMLVVRPQDRVTSFELEKLWEYAPSVRQRKTMASTQPGIRGCSSSMEGRSRLGITLRELRIPNGPGSVAHGGFGQRHGAFTGPSQVTFGSVGPETRDPKGPFLAPKRSISFTGSISGLLES